MQSLNQSLDCLLQDFVSAVDKLLKVRSSTISLKHKIGELNQEVQAGGASLGGKVSSPCLATLEAVRSAHASAAAGILPHAFVEKAAARISADDE